MNPGENTNPWHDRRHGKNGWLLFTSVQPATLSGFRLRMHKSWDGSSFKHFNFQYSADGKSWKTAIRGQGKNQDCCAFQTFEFAPQTARFWKLNMIDNWGYGWRLGSGREADKGGPRVSNIRRSTKTTHFSLQHICQKHVIVHESV